MPYPYPVLFQIGPFSVFTFGIFMLVAFLLALWIAVIRSKGKIEEDHIYNVAIISIIASLVGARIAFILFNPQYFRTFYDFIAIWQGGMSFFGGLFLALIAIYFYTKNKKLSYAEILDIFAPGFALAIAITRIGGFISGANPGIPTELPWAVVGAHPAALYHALSNFLIFFILIWVAKSRFKEKFAPGYLFVTFLLFYGIERFFNDFFRLYDSTATIIAARTIPLILILVSVILLKKLRKKN